MYYMFFILSFIVVYNRFLSFDFFIKIDYVLRGHFMNHFMSIDLKE